MTLSISLPPACAIIEDEFVNSTLDKNLKIKVKKEISFTDETPVQIRIKEKISTKTKPEEGDYIEFETVSRVKSFPEGTTVKGRIEFVSMNFSYGVPAEILISNFVIDKTPLYGEIRVIGANRTLWLRPCIIVGTIFFGAGLALIPIRGGHAKIKPKDVYTVYLR